MVFSFGLYKCRTYPKEAVEQHDEACQLADGAVPNGPVWYKSMLPYLAASEKKALQQTSFLPLNTS